MGSGKPRPKPRLRGALAAAKASLSLSRSASSASASASTSTSASASVSAASAASAGPGTMRAPGAAPPPRGGLLFDAPSDRALADRQRAALRFVAARLGGQLLSGNVSLKSTAMPVHLNEPRSFLQRLTDELVHVRTLHEAAAGAWEGGAGAGLLAGIGGLEDGGRIGAVGCADPARRLALVAAFLVAGLRESASMAKVYNPQIGETYAADFGPTDDRARVYLEQSRHHPPVSHFTASPSSGAYRLSGYTSFDSQFRVAESALYTRRTGMSAVDFGGDPSDRIVFMYPTVVVRGVLAGERRVDVVGPCSLYYERYNLVMDLVFDPMSITTGHSPVSAVASLIPSFNFFSTSSAERSQSAVATDVRDSCGDAVRGVLYQVLPESRTRFSGAFAACCDGPTPTYFGRPEAAASSGNYSGDGERRPIELRSDKDTTVSVSAAWAAEVEDDCVTPAHGEGASPEGMSRRILALASGSWLSHFDVAGVRLWDEESPRHEVTPVPLEESLPSDSRRREDMIALQRALSVDEGADKALDAAQEVKERLENDMRAESKLRPVPELVTDPFFPTCHLGAVPK